MAVIVAGRMQSTRLAKKAISPIGGLPSTEIINVQALRKI